MGFWSPSYSSTRENRVFEDEIRETLVASDSLNSEARYCSNVNENEDENESELTGEELSRERGRSSLNT
jgi:hypothetical protein